jgi:hypothetical protein
MGIAYPWDNRSPRKQPAARPPHAHAHTSRSGRLQSRLADLPPLNEAISGARILGGRNQGRARNATSHRHPIRQRRGGRGTGRGQQLFEHVATDQQWMARERWARVTGEPGHVERELPHRLVPHVVGQRTRPGPGHAQGRLSPAHRAAAGLVDHRHRDPRRSRSSRSGRRTSAASASARAESRHEHRSHASWAATSSTSSCWWLSITVPCEPPPQRSRSGLVLRRQAPASTTAAMVANIHVEGSGTGATARKRGASAVDQLRRNVPAALNLAIVLPL